MYKLALHNKSMHVGSPLLQTCVLTQKHQCTILHTLFYITAANITYRYIPLLFGHHSTLCAVIPKVLCIIHVSHSPLSFHMRATYIHVYTYIRTPGGSSKMT